METRDFPFKMPAAGLWGQEKLFLLWVISHPVCDSCMRSDEVNTHACCTILSYMILQRCMLAFFCHAVNRLGCSLDWMEMWLEGEMCVCMSGQHFASADGRGLTCCQRSLTLPRYWACSVRPVRSMTEFWCKHRGDRAAPSQSCPSILNANINIRSAVLL